MRAPTFELSEEQIARFHRQQYLGIDRITDDADITRLRIIYDDLIGRKAGWDSGDHYDLGGLDDLDKQPVLPQLVWPTKYAPELDESQLLVNGTRITKQLFGDKARCFIFHFIYKPPQIGAATPWHQDASYWPIDADYQAITIWVPLQDVTPESGCMQFVPGSQDLGVLPHRSINNDPRIHGNELTPEALSHVKDAVKCPLQAGGATIHGPRILHHTAANRTDVQRRALILLGEIPHEESGDERYYPWMEEKRTLREERHQSQAAAERQSKSAGP